MQTREARGNVTACEHQFEASGECSKCRAHVVDERAPRGFKGHYWRVWRDSASAEVLRDLLGLVGYDVSVETIALWSRFRRVEAEVYAANAHGRASDNILRKHPLPAWWKEC